MPDAARQCQLAGRVTGTGSAGYGVCVILLTAFVCGCAARGATPAPFPTVKAAKSEPESRGAGEPAVADDHDARPAEAIGTGGPISYGMAVVQNALGLLGRPYAPGGSGPERFDCSGLVQYAYARAGFAVPRTVAEQFEVTRPVPGGAVAPGDLLFFRVSGREPSHVGIALGDGTFVHAPSERGQVRVERLDSEYWRRRLFGARRVSELRMKN